MTTDTFGNHAQPRPRPSGGHILDKIQAGQIPIAVVEGPPLRIPLWLIDCPAFRAAPAGRCDQ